MSEVHLSPHVFTPLFGTDNLACSPPFQAAKSRKMRAAEEEAALEVSARSPP